MRERSTLTVDVGKICENIEKIKRFSHSGIYAVLKANAYGMGAVEIARYIEKSVDGIFVATPQEGVELRKNDIRTKIWISGCFDKEDYEICRQFDMIASVHSFDTLGILETMPSDCIPRLSVAIDTGMSRFGFSCGNETDEITFSEKVRDRVVLAYTHLYDGGSVKTSEIQKKRFDWFCANNFDKHGITVEKSVDNSKSVFLGYAGYDHVRIGIGLYGFMRKGTKIAIRLTSKIVSIKNIERGDGVGYGAIYVSPCRKKIAVVSMGYADGYPTTLGNRGVAIVRIFVIGTEKYVLNKAGFTKSLET